MSVITPGGIPRDARLRDSPATPGETELALKAWNSRDAEHAAERDTLIRAAFANGINKRQIALRMGISRTTVYEALKSTGTGQAATTTEDQS